jgi:hypothetical protein
VHLLIFCIIDDYSEEKLDWPAEALADDESADTSDTDEQPPAPASPRLSSMEPVVVEGDKYVFSNWVGEFRGLYDVELMTEDGKDCRLEIQVSASHDKESWKKEIFQFFEDSSDYHIRKYGMKVKAENWCPTDYGGMIVDVLRTAVDDYLDDEDGPFDQHAGTVKYLKRCPEEVDDMVKFKLETFGRILVHCFLARQYLAWPAKLDPLLAVFLFLDTQDVMPFVTPDIVHTSFSEHSKAVAWFRLLVSQLEISLQSDEAVENRDMEKLRCSISHICRSVRCCNHH